MWPGIFVMWFDHYVMWFRLYVFLTNQVPRVLSLLRESTLADSGDVIEGRGWKVIVCLH